MKNKIHKDSAKADGKNAGCAAAQAANGQDDEAKARERFRYYAAEVKRYEEAAREAGKYGYKFTQALMLESALGARGWASFSDVFLAKLNESEKVVRRVSVALCSTEIEALGWTISEDRWDWAIGEIVKEGLAALVESGVFYENKDGIPGRKFFRFAAVPVFTENEQWAGGVYEERRKRDWEWQIANEYARAAAKYGEEVAS